MHERTHVGLDVHALSVVACAIDGQTGEILRARLTPDHGEILAWLRACLVRAGWFTRPDRQGSCWHGSCGSPVLTAWSRLRPSFNARPGTG